MSSCTPLQEAAFKVFEIDVAACADEETFPVDPANPLVTLSDDDLLVLRAASLGLSDLPAPHADD